MSGLAFFDSDVALYLLVGCRTLYSEDFQHGQTFDGLTIVNPFR